MRTLRRAKTEAEVKALGALVDDARSRMDESELRFVRHVLSLRTIDEMQGRGIRTLLARYRDCIDGADILLGRL